MGWEAAEVVHEIAGVEVVHETPSLSFDPSMTILSLLIRAHALIPPQNLPIRIDNRKSPHPMRAVNKREQLVAMKGTQTPGMMILEGGGWWWSGTCCGAVNR